MSIIDHQSHPVLFTAGSFSYNQNSPDNRAGITRVQNGVRPARNSYNSYPAIIRKSSHKEAASPFHHSSSASQVWGPKDAQKPYIKEKVSPSQTGRYWSSSLPTSRGHYGGYKETNELAAAGAPSPSSGIQSSKFLGFTTQTAPRAPSISDSLDASVIKSIPSPEKLASSITDFSQGLQRRKNVQSYLFKDAQTSFGGRETVHDGPSAFSTTPHRQTASNAQVYSSFSSNVKQDPTKEVQHLSENANPLYHNAKVAQDVAPTDTKYQQVSRISSAPAKDNTMESFVPIPPADFQGNFGAGSKKSAVSSFVNTTTRGSTHAYKPGQTTKSIYGFRGFENPTWRASSGSNGRTNSGRYSFNEGKDHKIANLYPSLSRKYNFGQREAAKLERTTTQPPSPRPFASGFKEVRPLQLESDAGLDSNPDRRQFRVSKRIYGLKGFRPLEGAKTLLREPDKSARVQQGFEGFELRSPQIWQPKSSHVSTMSEDLKAEGTESRFTPDKHKERRKIYTFLGFQPVQNQVGNADNKALRQNHTKASPSHVISSSYFRSAGKLRIDSSPKSEARTPNKSVEMRASLLNRSTSSTVRGKRVKGNGKKLNESTLTNINAAIVRLPKRPAKIIAITYADILGSASFSGVTATTQTPITVADKDYYPNATVMTEQEEEADHWMLKSEDDVLSKDNTSRGLEDFSEENKPSVRSKEVNSDKETSDFFLDNEGSGSGDFNMSDVLPTDTTKSQRLSEDSLELDYLRKSTGNISFKSMNTVK